MSLVGSEVPRVFTPPLRELTPDTTLGFDAIRFAETVLGMELNPWQSWFLKHALELNEDGSPRFRTVVLIVGRQNGKTTIVKVLCLFYLFALRVAQVLSTAHKLDTARKAWREAVREAESVPVLKSMISRPYFGAGDERLELLDGAAWAIAAANEDGGRGYSVDLLVVDELRQQKNYEAWGALTSTTIAREDAITIALSSAGDEKSAVLKDLRSAATEAIVAEATAETSLGLFEWSADPDADIDDLDGWAQANPSLGHTLTLTALRAERDKSRAAEHVFRTENLGQWVQAAVDGPWQSGVFASCADLGSSTRAPSSIDPASDLFVSVDVSFNRSMAHLGVAGFRPDGLPHLEVMASRPGTDWVVPGIVENWDEWGAEAVVIQGSGAPASSLIEYLEGHGIPVIRCEKGGIGDSWATLYDAVRDDKVRHLHQPVLMQAAEVAQVKTLGDRVVLDRRSTWNVAGVDVAPLIAVGQALWALKTRSEIPSRRRRSAYEDSGLEVV